MYTGGETKIALLVAATDDRRNNDKAGRWPGRKVKDRFLPDSSLSEQWALRKGHHDQQR